MFERHSRMSGSVLKDLLYVQECLESPPECPGGPLRCLGVVGKPFRMFERPSRMFGSVRKALLYIEEWSRNPLGCPGGPLGCPGVFGRPS